MEEKIRYELAKFGDCKKDDTICADEQLSDAEKISYMVALNLGMIKEDDFLWFGNKQDYPYGIGDNAWIIRKTRE
jgi:hypothetical protein